MRFDAHFGEAEAVQLKAAILLYGGAKRIAFASVHEPYRDPDGGAPYLDAGRPISTEFLRTLARGLGLGMGPEILPETVVMRTPEVTAWWVPAAVRTMFFSETSDGKTLNGKSYPHPPLLFVVDGEHGLSVRALMENRRPGPRSGIAIAPYWNVNQAGGVCLGSMATPRSAGLASLGEWVEGFFQSEFTHAGNVKITSHREGHLGLWRDLAGRQALLAVQLYQRGVPLIAFENALVLAVTRRLVRPAAALPLGTIRSLAYFVPVIEEVLEIKVGQDYFEYLRFRLSRSSPNLTKTPASR